MKTITKALTAHHNEIRKLVNEVKNDSSKFIFLKKNLDVHYELEEDLFLSKLQINKRIKDESLESQEEHVILNLVLLNLANFPKDNERWMIKFKVFEAILYRHLNEEEEELFPEAEKIMDRIKLFDLGAKFEELKVQRLMPALKTKLLPELETPKLLIHATFF